MQDQLTTHAIAEYIARPCWPDQTRTVLPPIWSHQVVNPKWVGYIFDAARLGALLFALYSTALFAFADEPPAAATPDKPPVKQKLLERRPFDVVILTKAAGGATLEVQTISLPRRPPT